MIPINNTVPPISCGDAIKNGFKNYANFGGRIRRSEFWHFALFNIICSVILLFANLATGKAYDFGKILRKYPVIGYLDIIYTLVMIIPISSSIVRRLHDIGKSGGNVFVIIVPISGLIVLLIHLCTDSEQKDNKYGPSQKYIVDNNLLVQNTNANTIQPVQPQNGYSIQLNLVPNQNNIPQQNNYIQPNYIQSQNLVVPQNAQPLIPLQNPINQNNYPIQQNQASQGFSNSSQSDNYNIIN